MLSNPQKKDADNVVCNTFKLTLKNLITEKGLKANKKKTGAEQTNRETQKGKTNWK